VTEEVKTPAEGQVPAAPVTPAPVSAPSSDPEDKDLTKLRKENADKRIKLRETTEELDKLKLVVADVVPKIEALEKRAADAEKAAEIARRDAAGAKYGLPAEIVARLVGSTPAELEADAAKLAALIKAPASNPNQVPVTPGNVASGSGEKSGGQSLFERTQGRRRS
jgi:hypothetical protein